MSGSTVNIGTHVFVSYAAEDRPTAERVVRALTSLGWQVWWDREIVPGKTFDERIADRLRSAGAVVVLWSRHSVSSEWVREEASDAKQRDVLIPAFIERVEPPFGFKLRHAVDLTSWNGIPSASEFSTLATAIRDIIPPVPERASSSATGMQQAGEFRRIARRVTPASLMLAVLLTAAAASGLWYWDAYHRVQLEHYANVTKRHGLPQGIGRLDTSQGARRNVSLALIRHGRRNPVDEVRLVNSRGNTPPTATYIAPFSFADLNPLPSSAFDINDAVKSELATVTRVTFSRDASGGILEQNGFARGGRPVYTLHYGNPETGEYKRHGFASPIRASGIGYVRFARVRTGPNAGLDEKVMYLDAAQQSQPDESGEYGYRLLFDERGLIREKVALGPNFEDRPNNYGLLKEIRSHDPLGHLTEGSNFDQKGARVPGRIGAASVRMQGDFYVSIRREYTVFGKVAKATFLDASGNPRKIRGGYASIAYTYDSSGNRVREAYLDEEGRPTVIVGGYAAQAATYDTRGLETLISFLGANGRPARNDEGIAAIRSEYDERGFLEALTFLDEDGRPVKSIYGYALDRIKRNARGQPLEIAYFDEHEVPVVSTRPGSARRRWTYDSLGKVLERSDYDTAGRPMRNAYGYCTLRYSYDEHGRETGRQLLDASGRPVMLKVSIDSVTRGSVAADAGLRAGDFIVAYDGEPVATSYEFTNRFELFKGDRRREIRVDRAGQIIGLDLPPGRITGLELQEKAHP